MCGWFGFLIVSIHGRSRLSDPYGLCNPSRVSVAFSFFHICSLPVNCFCLHGLWLQTYALPSLICFCSRVKPSDWESSQLPSCAPPVLFQMFSLFRQCTCGDSPGMRSGIYSLSLNYVISLLVYVCKDESTQWKSNVVGWIFVYYTNF